MLSSCLGMTEESPNLEGEVQVLSSLPQVLSRVGDNVLEKFCLSTSPSSEVCFQFSRLKIYQIFF